MSAQDTRTQPQLKKPAKLKLQIKMQSDEEIFCRLLVLVTGCRDDFDFVMKYLNTITPLPTPAFASNLSQAVKTYLTNVFSAFQREVHFISVEDSVNTMNCNDLLANDMRVMFSLSLSPCVDDALKTNCFDPCRWETIRQNVDELFWQERNGGHAMYDLFGTNPVDVYGYNSIV